MGKSYSRLTPRIVNTLFLVLLQTYFKDHPEYPYHHDDYNTKIDIAVDYTEDDPVQKCLPLIVVQNGSMQLSASGFTSGLYQSTTQKVTVDNSYVSREAVRDTKVQMTFSSYTNLLIYAESKDDADELAFEVATLLMCCRPIIGEILQVQNIGDMQIQAASPVGTTGWIGKYQAAVNIPYVATVSRFVFPVTAGELLTKIETTLEMPRTTSGLTTTLEEQLAQEKEQAESTEQEEITTQIGITSDDTVKTEGPTVKDPYDKDSGAENIRIRMYADDNVKAAQPDQEYAEDTE